MPAARWILLLLAIFSSLELVQVATVHAANGTAAQPLWFTNVVWIILENHNNTDIWSCSCSPNATYLMGLADNYANATHMGYESTSGSLPNYIAMLGGWMILGSSCDSTPASCGTTGDANIIDRVAGAGLTWKGYMEDMPGTNICAGNGQSDGGAGTLYIAHHDPFVYFTDITGDSSRCKQVVPAGSYNGNTLCSGSNYQTVPAGTTVASTLLTDYASSSSAPNFAFVVPNNCDNMHNTNGDPNGNRVGEGNSWMKTLVPSLLTSTACVASSVHCAVIVTFDEGHDTDTTGAHDATYTVWAGPAAKNNYTSTTTYNHGSVLATVEANWGLAPLNATWSLGDGQASNMGPMLNLITYGSSPGGGAPPAPPASTVGGGCVPGTPYCPTSGSVIQVTNVTTPFGVAYLPSQLFASSTWQIVGSILGLIGLTTVIGEREKISKAYRAWKRSRYRSRGSLV